MTNPYHQLVTEHARLVREGKAFPLGGFAPAPRPEVKPDAPKVLIFSPHPDDECIVGGLALRLLREARMNVINVAVTQGSKKSRQAARWQELEGACGYLGFGLLPTTKNGLENITAKARPGDKPAWARSVGIIAKILEETKPRAILVPHERDWHETHIGTQFLVMDALASLKDGLECFVVETEFWGAMETPNLMIESSARDVGDLVTALSFHAGEVRRDPYHLLLPAWMQDNVRRGSELVGGPGAAAADFIFATLYRLRRWKQGRLEPELTGGKQVACEQNLASIFEFVKR